MFDLFYLVLGASLIIVMIIMCVELQYMPYYELCTLMQFVTFANFKGLCILLIMRQYGDVLFLHLLPFLSESRLLLFDKLITAWKLVLWNHACYFLCVIIMLFFNETLTLLTPDIVRWELLMTQLPHNKEALYCDC